MSATEAGRGPAASGYPLREARAAARWVRTVVELTPGRPAEGHEFDSLEARLIRYFATCAARKHKAFGIDRDVFSGTLLALVFRRFGRRLREVRYVGVETGRAFGQTRGGGVFEAILESHS